MQYREEPAYCPGDLITDTRRSCIYRVAGTGSYLDGTYYYTCRRICEGKTIVPDHFLDSDNSTANLSSVTCSMCREDWSYIESHIKEQFKETA